MANAPEVWPKRRMKAPWSWEWLIDSGEYVDDRTPEQIEDEMSARRVMAVLGDAHLTLGDVALKLVREAHMDPRLTEDIVVWLLTSGALTIGLSQEGKWWAQSILSPPNTLAK